MATTLVTMDCKLKISNDALYNYAKSRKISSANWRTFQHSKEKTCRGHNSPTKIPPPPPHESLNTVKVNCQRPTSAIGRPELKIPTLAKWLMATTLVTMDCKLKISNDALYNYAKSRKISSANWITF